MSRVRNWWAQRHLRRAERAYEVFEDRLHHFNKWVHGWSLPPSEHRRKERQLGEALADLNRLRKAAGLQTKAQVRKWSAIGWSLYAFGNWDQPDFLED